MFTSQEWSDLKVSDEAKGMKETSIVFQVSFWDDIVYALKVMGPLIKVLGLVDNEKKSLQWVSYIKQWWTQGIKLRKTSVTMKASTNQSLILLTEGGVISYIIYCMQLDII